MESEILFRIVKQICDNTKIKIMRYLNARLFLYMNRLMHQNPKTTRTIFFKLIQSESVIAS